jgi:hypothetical protein
LVNSRQKGARGETAVKQVLIQFTGLQFECTPGSGSGTIKGDLYIKGAKNRFCIEIKNYAESPLSDKVLTNKTNNLVQWWTKLLVQAKQCSQEPLLFFKYNRSKLFVATSIKPAILNKYLYISTLDCYIMLSEEWLNTERIKWLN